jgi:hypothetical protein
MLLKFVYNTFSFDEHGLCRENIDMTDWQNLASAQRIIKKRQKTT